MVIGASSADFEAGNSALELDVRDTSAAKSSGTGNHFKRVQLSANAYLLADFRRVLMRWASGANLLLKSRAKALWAI
ncbi:hypothetical protein [Chitinibacter sp. GC72]|uniref:hypothetical protein n=1 Tax=Chitinibacter sp. GC72 TaxID=1526917 RepID=UPI0012FA4060|nr:hypothetical protein [Chitinibacter sp. GC72]